ISSDGNNLSLQTNGTTQLSILNSNGNVGIGVDSPDEKLHVDGVVRIGTTASFLDISTGNDNLAYFQTNLNGYYFDQGIKIKSGVISSDANNLSLQTNGITQILLTAQGDVSIGNSLPASNTKLYVDGNLRVNGRILQDSSRELKENITELSSQEVTEILRTIKPIKFNYKNSVDKEIQAGFLSEDVPSLLTSSDNTAISPVDVVAVLTKAVKDQQVQISLLLNALREQRIQIATLVDKVRVIESNN
ncbi:tail fiber domain-containing protein, partial [Nodularia sp. LEGE 04288]